MVTEDLRTPQSPFGMKGALHVLIRDSKTGKKVDEYEMENLVVTSGFNIVRDRLAGVAIDPLTHFALGTGTTTPIVGDTALGTEVFRDTITQFVYESAVLKIKYYLSSADANGNTLGEAGAFNSSSGATMFNKVLISPTIVKTSSISVTFTWTITISGP